MIEEPEVSGIARMIGEPARAAMLSALLSGETLPAGELARHAHVTPATASEHLAQLMKHRLIVRRKSGRHVYYGLAGPEVAAVLEALARIAAPAHKPRAKSHPADPAMRFARTCYDHLAGHLGVRVTQAMLEQGLLHDETLALTRRGVDWLGSLDIDIRELQQSRRALSRPCLDWSERRDHLAGAVAAAITTTMLDRRWIVRIDGTRAVRLTQRGREGLRRALSLEIADQDWSFSPQHANTPRHLP